MQVEVPVEVVYMRVAGDQTEVEEHEKEDKYENGKEQEEVLPPQRAREPEARAVTDWMNCNVEEMVSRNQDYYTK